MAIRAVFFDLDGTLFTSTRRVASSTKKAIAEMKRKGLYVGIATGRGPAFVVPLMADLQLDFAVTFNGQYILTPEKVLYKQALDLPLLERINHYAHRTSRDISFGTEKGVVGSGLIKFGETRSAQVIAKLVPSGLSSVLQSGYKNLVRRFKPQKPQVLDPSLEAIYQVMMIASKKDTDQLALVFPELTITRSNAYSADLISHGTSKLTGIRRLAEHYHFSLEEVMVFGDSDNDLEMIRVAGLGIAMGNATTTIKSAADYVTDTNNNDGIPRALARFGLIDYSTAASFTSKDEQFNKVKAFHSLMDGRVQEIPRVFQAEEASHRVNFKVEELVEFLYAAANTDQAVFYRQIKQMHAAIDQASKKVQSKPSKEVSVLTAEVDALMDLLYFTYGSFALMGVDPERIFHIVHEANMGKVFPDGKPHFDPVTHKVLKPDNWETKYAPEDKIKKEVRRQIRIALGKYNKKK